MNRTMIEDNEQRTHTEPRLRDEVKNVKDDLGTLKEDAISVAKTGTGVTIDAARDVAEKAHKAHSALCAQVASRPTTSLLVAVGIGAICGRLLSRR